MIERKSKVFTTLDLYLSSFLTLRGLTPKLEISNHKVVFTFPVSDDLYRFMNEYNANISVPVTDLITYIKMLRGQMLTMRGAK
jgi:hypothetical protein